MSKLINVGDQYWVRHLDIDDLCILTMFHDGLTSRQICDILLITPPAISHRKNKYVAIWGSDFFYKPNKSARKILSGRGLEISRKMKTALYSLLELQEDVMFFESLKRKRG
jgi:hypothetical protein